MHLDVVELRRFYYATRLGALARRVVSDQLRALWPDLKGETLVGFGFAATENLLYFRNNSKARKGKKSWSPKS